MPTPIPIRHSDGSPLGHVTIHLPPEASPGDLIASIRDGEVVEYVHLPRLPALPALADRAAARRPAGGPA